jgi:hypothetical protein
MNKTANSNDTSVKTTSGVSSSATLESNTTCVSRTSSTMTIYKSPLIDTNSPLINEKAAKVVSKVSGAARISLKCSALLVGWAFQGAKYGTQTGLSIGRRALISAITAARDLHQLISDENDHNEITVDSTFFQFLDKYTNLGVYYVHSAFSLAEIFALTGFHLTQYTITGGLKAADESVRIIDGLFGSTETSRALAAFVSLVKRELLAVDAAHDPDTARLAQAGKIRVLTSILKALIAYACLQAVTHSQRQLDRVATVVHECELIDGVRQKDEQQHNTVGIVRVHDGHVVNTSVHMVRKTQTYDSSFIKFRRTNETAETDDLDDTASVMTTTVVEQEMLWELESIDDAEDIHRREDEEDHVYRIGQNHRIRQRHRYTGYSSTTSLHVINGTSSIHSEHAWLNSPPDPNTSTASVMIEELSNDEDSDASSVDWAMVGEEAKTTCPPIVVEPASDSNHGSRPSSTYDSDHLSTKDALNTSHSSRRGLGAFLNSVNHKLSKQRKQKRAAKSASATPVTASSAATSPRPSFPEPPPPPPRVTFARRQPSPSSALSRVNSPTRSPRRTHRSPPASPSSQQVAMRTSRAVIPGGKTRLKDLFVRPVFPQMSLVHAAQRFMHYASAAYGPDFLKLLGMARQHTLKDFEGTHHPNHVAFARHIGIPLRDVVHSSYIRPSGTPLLLTEPKLNPVVHYVCIDRTAKAVVLVLRGTLGLSDVLTDLLCTYADVRINGRLYRTHSGMLESARRLADPKSMVARHTREELERFPDYGLIICGHSLGAGVAALLSLLWSEPECDGEIDYLPADTSTKEDIPTMSWPPQRRFVTKEPLPPGRPIRCFAYASPCVADKDLYKYAYGLVTTIVHGEDVVPTLSLGVLHDFKAISVSLYAENSLAEDIIARCLGLRQGTNGGAPDAENMDADWFLSLIKTMRADMTSEKLYPPGEVYLIDYSVERFSALDSAKHRHCVRARMRRVTKVEERFGELIFSKRMFSDHTPNRYEKCLDALASRVADGERSAAENDADPLSGYHDAPYQPATGMNTICDDDELASMEAEASH